MSTVIMAACWPLQIQPTAKAVLMSLADNANDHGECWPSITTICKRTCLGRTAVIEAIKWLEGKSLLTADRSNGRHTRYLLTPNLDLFEEGKPVRQADQSGRRTSPPRGPNQSAWRTGPVRHADSNRQEPSRTVSSLSPRAEDEVELPTLEPGLDSPQSIEPTPAAVACMAMKRSGLVHVNPSHPKLLAALAGGVTAGELADVVTEVLAKGGAPPGLAYVCTTALNRRLESAREQTDAKPRQKRGSDRTAGRPSLADQAAERAARIFAARDRAAGDADSAGSG